MRFHSALVNYQYNGDSGEISTRTPEKALFF
jgi:hypothetical protein